MSGAVFAANPLPIEVMKLKSGEQTLTVGRYTFPPPFYSFNENMQKGLVTEIFDAVASRAGIKKVKYVNFNTISELRNACDRGKIDVISNVWDTPFNRNRYLLTMPFNLQGGIVLLYPKENGPFQTADDLRSHTVGILDRNYFRNYCFTVMNMPKGSMKEYSTLNALQLALERNEIDAALTFFRFAQYIQNSQPSKYRYTLLQSMHNVYAVRKQDIDLQKLLNQSLDSLWHDGTLNNILAKHH